jgi:protein-S-isoprenylcysteine O-methyltransferase Ste14
MILVLMLPLISVLVLPIGGLEYRLLQKTRWGILLGILNFTVLYGPWIVAVLRLPDYLTNGATAASGLVMLIAGLILLIVTAPLILRAPGQMRTVPRTLLTEGPYRWTRHPLYVGHALLISGGVLAFASLELFLVTPILWVIAAIASRYEENTRLKPQFGEAFRQYQAQTPFLLPLWGWILWGIIYLGAMAQSIVA